MTDCIFYGGKGGVGKTTCAAATGLRLADAGRKTLLVEYVDSDEWDVVVFDTAPTGHTLRLFDTPAVIGPALETLRSLRGQARRIGDAAKSAVFGPMSMMTGSSGGDGEESLEAFQARLERAQDVLRDSERTEFRVVLLPEGMAIAESERLVETLREAEVRIDRVVVNRVFEDPEAGCARCQSRYERHSRRVSEIREAFPDLEVETLPEAEGKVQGLEAVREVAERLAIET